MDEKLDILGQWWLPNEPDEKWIGTLTLKPNASPRLTVTVPRPYFSLAQDRLPAAIHGHDEHGKHIALLIPRLSGISSSAAISQVKIAAAYALLGIHIAEASALTLHSLALGLQHLYEWSGISGLVHRDPGIQIQYACPEDQVFSVSPDLKVELKTAAIVTSRVSERAIKEDTCLVFHSCSGLSLSRCKHLLTAVRQLLHFAVLEPVYPLWMTGERNDYGYTAQGQFIAQEIKMFHSIVHERVESELQQERWVFRFEDVQSRFAQFFGDWLKLNETFDEALKCYSTTVYHRLPASVQHLCLAQALEAYHGTKFVGEHTFKERFGHLPMRSCPI